MIDVHCRGVRPLSIAIHIYVMHMTQAVFVIIDERHNGPTAVGRSSIAETM